MREPCPILPIIPSKVTLETSHADDYSTVLHDNIQSILLNRAFGLEYGCSLAAGMGGIHLDDAQTSGPNFPPLFMVLDLKLILLELEDVRNTAAPLVSAPRYI